jgi:ribonuclease D
MNTEVLPVHIAGDLTESLAYDFEISGKEYGIAVDIETTGLSATNESIQVVSMAVPGFVAVITTEPSTRPTQVIKLLENRSITKIFHNAIFDCSFLLSNWSCYADPVFCTKIGARLAGINRNPTLKDLTSLMLGVELDKSEQVSDWTRRPLTAEQIRYAARDVQYLHDLQRLVSRQISDTGQSELFEDCMRFVHARTQLNLLGFGDVYAYSLPVE